MAIKTFAAIDVGSFELELGIYEISGKYGIREIDHLRHVLALGKDTMTERSHMCWWTKCARSSGSLWRL